MCFNCRHGFDKSGGVPSTAALQDAASLEAPFSSAETLVWDWQAIALTSGIFACVLFFFVITLYSLHQARQWRRLKENFEAGKYFFCTKKVRVIKNTAH